jgi:hypothetical protein
MTSKKLLHSPAHVLKLQVNHVDASEIRSGAKKGARMRTGSGQEGVPLDPTDMPGRQQGGSSCLLPCLSPHSQWTPGL